MSSAGRIEINVSEPYPVWCQLVIGKTKVQLHHNELSDLRYAVNKAMQEARLKLGDMGEDEV